MNSIAILGHYSKNYQNGKRNFYWCMVFGLVGKNSFDGRNLHDLDFPTLNQYEQAISIIAQTLSGFDEDGLIPCYGFGDGE